VIDLLFRLLAVVVLWGQPAATAGRARQEPPPFWVKRPVVAPPRLEHLLRQLDDATWTAREQATVELSRHGFAALRVLDRGARSASPEVRRRCCRLRDELLGGFPAPHAPFNESWPPIFNLTGPLRQTPEGNHRTPEYLLALVTHYYYARALAERPAAIAERQQAYFGTTRTNECRATGLLLHDLRRAGVDPAWMRWLLRDMEARLNRWPRRCVLPPRWLLHHLGARPSVVRELYP
jgi:hypothetical protein